MAQIHLFILISISITFTISIPRQRIDYNYKNLDDFNEEKKPTPSPITNLTTENSTLARTSEKIKIEKKIDNHMNTEWVIPIKLLSVLGINIAISFIGIIVFRCIKEWQKLQEDNNPQVPRQRPPPYPRIHFVNQIPNHAVIHNSFTRVSRKG